MLPDRWGSDYDYAEAHGNHDDDREPSPHKTIDEALAAFWRLMGPPPPRPAQQRDDPAGLDERRWSQR